jgi:hypothetical protein
MLGVVRHDNCVRVPLPIREKRLAVVRWIFGPSREAFSVDVPHKKCSFCGNPGGGPPTVVEEKQPSLVAVGRVTIQVARNITVSGTLGVDPLLHWSMPTCLL